MKKMIFLMLGTTLITGVFAQTSTVKDEKKELEKNIADKKEDKHEVGNDLAHLRFSEAVKDRQEVRNDRSKIRKKGKHLKKHHGIKHPIHDAKVEVKEDKDARKGKD